MKYLRSMFGIGQGEAKAVVSLVTRIPEEAIDILKKAGAKWSVVHGPVSHAGIGAAAMGTSEGRKSVSNSTLHKQRELDLHSATTARKAITIWPA